MASKTDEDMVIDAKKLCLTFDANDGPVHALKDVDLGIQKGDFVSFIGPSGCGKTTLLRVIADLEHPTSGSITVNGMTPEQARLERAYGYVFQAPALLAWRTIERNVGLPLEIMGLSAAEKPNVWRVRWISSGSTGLGGNSRGNCPAACSSVPPSPARWPLMPICC